MADTEYRQAAAVQRSYRELGELVVAEFYTIDIGHVLRKEILERYLFQFVELEVQTGQQV